MYNGYKVIDTHCHIYPAKIAKKAADHIGDFYNYKATYVPTADNLVETGTQAGVDSFVVCSVATTPLQVRTINKFIADEVDRAGKGRMTGLGTFHPETEDPAGDVADVLSRGLHGIKIHPEMQGFAVDDPRFCTMYELCADSGLTVLIHTGDDRYDCSNPNRLLPLFKEYKDTTFVGAHFSGYSVYMEASQTIGAAKLPNVYCDISSSFYQMSDYEIIECIKLWGPEKCMFATDFPSWPIEKELERFLSLGFSEKENRMILSENAEKVYGIRR